MNRIVGMILLMRNLCPGSCG